ncbi:MAG: winged helix-turn-helix domain-containing protein [Chloroflexi bacterium]|nr:winged helix-turn-helix domain-containing protein [Chloroflexota bacterium]
MGDKVLSLPPAAFDYLAVLARHAPNTVDYQTLVNEAQGYQTESFQAKDLAKWHIHQLREALETNPDDPKYIVNMRGVGYRLVVD